MKRALKVVPLFVVPAVYRQGDTSTARHLVWARWSSKAVTLGLMMCLLGLAVHAQEGAGVRPAPESSAASGGGAEPKAGARDDGKCGGSVQCLSDKIESLRPGWERRLARGFQYQYQLNEQLDTVLINFGIGADAIPRLRRNPEDYLQQHTLSFKFGELFPDRLALFKRGSDYLKKHPQAADRQPSELLCGDKPLITCLAKGGSWWQRALMGSSVSVTFSERAEVVQGFLVTSPKFGKEFQVNGGFVFDPAKLFTTATNWKGAFDEAQKVDKALALLGASDVRSGRRPWERQWAAAFIPKVELKVQSQFDFVKHEGVLIEAPFSDRALSTWTFTWDLTRAIPDTRSRIDADAIAEAMAGLENNMGRDEDPSWQKRCVLSLPNEGKDREVKDLHPAFRAESCQGLARLMKAERYQLSCVLKDKDGGADKRVDGPWRRSTDAPARPPETECKW
ncbi:MAG: hypothetical protein LC800_21470 [Acidobacteria bacterium]|nr:hypothetical protein [Acidobacteriota bacterium]